MSECHTSEDSQGGETKQKLQAGNLERPVGLISLIIPTLNEETNLPSALQALKEFPDACECVVVDGGSQDGTVALAKSLGAQVLIAAQAGRAGQMNLGAKVSRGQILLFLHADTCLPTGWLAALDGCLRDPTVVGGAFSRRFQSPSRFLAMTCVLADWRGRRCGVFLGDQAIFTRRDCFLRMGGFREDARCEDLEFSLRLRQMGRTRLLELPVETSARRFNERGPLRTTLADLRIALSTIIRAKRRAGNPRNSAT